MSSIGMVVTRAIASRGESHNLKRWQRIFFSSMLLIVLGVSTSSGRATDRAADENDGSLAGEQVADTDGDGLSDFHERHKYLTNPLEEDSDQDGVPDGDWLERREFQYTIRSVVQVMRPVTIEYLNDDYQDVRVLDETDEYVEMEVIHYPFNTVRDAMASNDEWQSELDNLGDLGRWLEPGPTSDWTPEFREQVIEALEADGIVLDDLDDREAVEAVSRWLLERAEYDDGFSTFITAFDEQGNPFIPDSLRDAPEETAQAAIEAQWEREVSAVGMFQHEKRGSCSSSSIYLSGCLRAIGIPTRTILCIPIVDASDESEMAMVQRLQQSGVRKVLLGALRPIQGSWASHTFNEVYVGGRWRRLNYANLGQNIYDPQYFGLMTHVATFHDWADAKMPETIGLRQQSRPNDVFGGPNPYSTISLRDSIGVHCQVELPSAETTSLLVESIDWTDSPSLPESIRENCAERGRFGLIATVSGFEDPSEVPGLLQLADLRVVMKAVRSESDVNQSVVDLGVGFDPGCYWLGSSKLMIYVPYGGGDQRDLVEGADYEFTPRNGSQDVQWKIDDKLVIRR